MMDAKGGTYGGGRRGPNTGIFDDFPDDFLTTTTRTTTSNRNSAAFVDDDNNNNDASDDLRLDDFIGVSETENNNDDAPLGGGNFRSSITSSSSVRRSKKLLRKKKQAAAASPSSPSPSPVIVVEGVDGRTGEEEVEVEGVTLKDAGNEKGGEEKKGSDDDADGDLRKEMRKNDVSDADMDFGVLEVVSSHLNLDASKQKTSLRKKGSMARRKKPTRHTVALPTGASDNIFMDSTDDAPGMTYSSQTDLTDDVDSGKQTTLDSSTDTAGTPRTFVPRKPPMMIPGLQDLTKSRLFNQERQKRGEHSPPTTTTGAADSSTSPPSTVEYSTLWQSPGSDEPAPEPAPESGTSGGLRGKSLYKKPVWLSEMKAKTSSATDTKAEEAAPLTTEADEELDMLAKACAGDEELFRAGNLHTPTIRNVSNFSSTSSTNTTSSSSSTVDGSSARRAEGLGLRRRGVSPGVMVGAKKEEQQKPVWMRAALEKTSRVADSLHGQKDNQDNRQKEDDDDNRAAPPWAAELKRKNRPLVGAGKTSSGDNPSEGAETPSKKSTEIREREVYTPSWANQNQLNNSNTSSPRDPGKGKATNGSAADVRGPQGSPLQTGEVPRWKLELAERNKRRQSGQSGTAGSSDGKSGTSSNSGAGSDTTDSPSPSPSLPAWRQQLKARKSSLPTTETPVVEGGGSPSPDWAKQVQERRARLMKSGLLGEDTNESHC